jgi:hypothetical protein
MATFTMRLKDVIELEGGDLDELGSTEVAAICGLADYPLTDSAKRAELNTKIVRHYFNQEIGRETIEMWRMAMSVKMAEIMPYYDELYKSLDIEFDPISTVDITTTTEGTTNQTNQNTGTSHTENENVNKSRAINSAFPQNMLAGNADYATDGGDVTSTGTVEGTGTEEATLISDVDTSAETRTQGFSGIGSELLMRYRASIINIDLSIINELEELFMLVWDNGDDHTNTNERHYL